jgi:hypothetical protein
MSEPYCAVCANRVAPDLDHVEIAAETIYMDDRNDQDEYYFHLDCWTHVSGGWEEP